MHTILKNQSFEEKLALSDVKKMYKAIVTKTVWYKHNQKQQWNHMESFIKDLPMKKNMVYDKCAMAYQWEQRIHFINAIEGIK